MPITPYRNLAPEVHASCFVHPSSEIIGEVRLGKDVSVWPGVILRGDRGAIVVDARTNLQDGVIAHATGGISSTTIGADCTVGHRAILHGCQVGVHCLIGMGAILMDNTVLGEWCFVGAGALLTPKKEFAPRSLILGSPARRVREIGPSEIAVIERSTLAYLELAAAHRG